MVTRNAMRRAVLVLFGAVILLAAGGSPALAIGGGEGPGPGPVQSPPPPGSPSSQPPPASGGGGSTSSSDGPVYGHDAGCSLYATASSFGLSCVTGGGAVSSKTVKQVLGKDQPPSCWDEKISAADLAGKYGLAEPGDGSYAWFMHYCVSGLQLDAPVAAQTALQLNPKIIAIATGAKPCPSPQPATAEGKCVMTLSANQRQVVDLGALSGGQIPPIVIETKPSTRVRTNEQIVFVNKGGPTRTADYQVGAVRMWAQLDGFAIYPYGPDGLREGCDGAANVQPPADTPQTKPSACWWKYPKSSADQPSQAYPLRAEADWTVYVADAAGTHAFASFHKYYDGPLPVYDIQTLVIH